MPTPPPIARLAAGQATVFSFAAAPALQSVVKVNSLNTASEPAEQTA